MNSEKTGLSEKEIIETLFNFIKQHFDELGHRPDGNTKWWHHTRYGGSWAPFVEACFIIEGERRGYGKGEDKIGHSYTHHNITDFFLKIFKRTYDNNSKYDNYLDIDFSWRTKDKLILALEHSEDPDKSSKGITTADKQLDAIFQELDKLKNVCSLFKIVVSRPHIRDQDKGDYDSVVKYFKEEIEIYLSQTKPRSDENWIITLIALGTDLKKADERTKIKFHSYKWEINKLAEVEGDYSFEVKMDNGGNIIKV